MIKKSKAPAQRQADLLVATEALARQWVDHWIECGDMFTQDMKDAAGRQVLTFQDFLIRDIDLYARTGKYPKYAEEEDYKRNHVLKEVMARRLPGLPLSQLCFASVEAQELIRTEVDSILAAQLTGVTPQ